MVELISKIKSAMELSPMAEEFLLKIGRNRKVTKGMTLIHQGQKVDKVFFVNDGCLRSFVVDNNGKEHTLQFAIKSWWMSDYIGIHNNEPAHLNVECISEANLIEFNAKELDGVLDKFPEFEPFQRKQLERHVVALELRILDQLRLSASERYESFLQKYGDIEQSVANFHIASYLGITQESLSRIRLKKNKK